MVNFCYGKEPIDIEMDDEKVKVCAEFVTQNLKKIEEHLRKNPDMTLGWPDAKFSASC